MVRGSQYKYTNCILSSTTVSQWCQWKFTGRSASLSWTICSLLRSQFSSSLLHPHSTNSSFQFFETCASVASLLLVESNQQWCRNVFGDIHQPGSTSGCQWWWVLLYICISLCSHTWELFFVTNKSRKRRQDFYIQCPWIWPTGCVFILLSAGEQKQTHNSV